MKRLWAVILTAATLAGCRSAQPATNPFMRTTVPPPGTGQSMMVMPGEAYPPGGPGVVTPGAPAAVSPAVPVTPGPAQPLIAPPPIPPKQEKFQPPGGSYLYHQSSHDRAGADASSDGARVKFATTEHAGNTTLRIDGGAPARASPDDEPLVLRFQAKSPDAGGDPSDKLSQLASDEPGGGSTVRIVGESSPSAAPDADSTAAREILRFSPRETDSAADSTAARETLRFSPRETRPEGATADGASSPRAATRIAIATPSADPPTTLRLRAGDRAVTQAAYQPDAAADKPLSR